MKISSGEKKRLDMNISSIGSAFVKLSHKINYRIATSQVVRIEGKLYRVRELG